ncbi:GTP 3',8-cyclase MoaA [Streptomyces polychromogenes]|uniref:GTP 3',8-cyclase MoaA n=1 Tax=Streptomyces polychromogenes TaxID=67342 RepID=A0ABP3F1E6_9ACTN
MLLHKVPVEVRPDDTGRVKIDDDCGLACVFCHNEGTPVTADNRDAQPGQYTGTPGKTGRVSIYLADNGARFLAARIEPGPDFALALAGLRGSIRTREIHFTGGEPTLHPRLPALVRQVRDMGFTVGLTSNGENGAAVLEECAQAGLDRINLSVFGTTATELAAVQAPRFASVSLAEKKIAALEASIETGLRSGIKVSANLVVSDHTQIPRALRIVERYGRDVTVRFLVNLETEHGSREAIHETLAALDAVPVRHIITAGTSDERTRYRLPDGRTVYAKNIRPVRLPDTCAGCKFNNTRDCQEGYYGVRVYRAKGGPYMVGVCIRRMDFCVSVGEFVMSQRAREVQAFRDDETARLTALYPQQVTTLRR